MLAVAWVDRRAVELVWWGTGQPQADLPDVFGLDTSPTTGQTGGMSVKVGISLPERTHARAVERARSMGTTLSGLIDAALRAELTRREVADHVAMLAEADDADRLRARARARSRALSAWKSGQ
jgi:hypothetical protein